jgi:aspartate/methionine/tyrosine aminotransferase
MYRPARRLADIEPFHVVELLTRARQLEAEGRDIIHMEVGEPDFPTPAPIANAAVDAIKSGKTFTPSRSACLHCGRQFRISIAAVMASTVPASRIAVTNGASGALNLAFACLADPGSEWLLADPGYPCNRHICGFTKGDRSTSRSARKPTSSRRQRCCASTGTPRTAGLLVASPANPTGTLLTLAEIKALADACRELEGHFLVDEIYHGLTTPRRKPHYETDAPTACAAGDDIWVINSFSKYFQMTGWRLGWMVIPEAYVRDVEKLAQNLTLCPSRRRNTARWPLSSRKPSPSSKPPRRVSPRRDFLAPALERIGFRITARPEGAFYLYCDCSGCATTASCWPRPARNGGRCRHTRARFRQQRAGKAHPLCLHHGVDRLAEAAERLARYFGRQA